VLTLKASLRPAIIAVQSGPRRRSNILNRFVNYELMLLYFVADRLCGLVVKGSWLQNGDILYFV
jgi:hypothetical protein